MSWIDEGHGMTCYRCTGLMHLESVCEVDDPRWILQAVCYICGERLDRIILRNRLAQKHGVLPRPRLLSWTPQSRIKPVVVWP